MNSSAKPNNVQKEKFVDEDFFSQCEQIHTVSCGFVYISGKILNVRRTILCNETIFYCREAARECRRKKKEYVKCLENRVAVLENQNKALIEELKSLKDLYCSKGD